MCLCKVLEVKLGEFDRKRTYGNISLLPGHEGPQPAELSLTRVLVQKGVGDNGVPCAPPGLPPTVPAVPSTTVWA